MSQGESQLSQPVSRILSSLGGPAIGGIAVAVLVAGCTGGHSGFERPDPEDLMPPPDVSESWRQYPPPPSQAPPVQEPAPAGSPTPVWGARATEPPTPVWGARAGRTGEAGPHRWRCRYDPTYNDDWHDDILCTRGEERHRPYLREWDSFITYDEIIYEARLYEEYLNSGRDEPWDR